jgi:NADH dehydrogenase FAD-containing subunit
MEQKSIVILGGSYGGVSTAHNVLKHVIPSLPHSSTFQVVLVSTSSHAMCRPACPRALISDDLFNQEKLFVSIPKQFEQYKSSFRFWKAFREALPAAKSIVIAGGGPTGVETAGELGEHLNGRAGWFSTKPAHPKVAITLISAGDNLLSNLRPALAHTAESYLAKVGVTVVKNVRVKDVKAQGSHAATQNENANTSSGHGTDDVAAKASLSLDNDTTLETDLYIPAFGMRPNTSFITDPALLTADRRIATDASTLRVEAAGPRVYAVGDVSSYAQPAIHQILVAIPVLTANLKRDLLAASGENNKGEDRIFKEDTRETQLVPIGKSKGVGAAMGYKLPSFLVWLIKGRDYWLWTTGNLWSGKQWAKEG